jgi:hypothetical protein
MIGRLMHVDQLLERVLAGETQVFRENPPQCHFMQYKSQMNRPKIEPGSL